MRPEIQRVYLQEIQNQCIIAQQAVADMTDLLLPAHTGSMFGGQTAQSVRFWFALQSFLTAAASISKLLWPSTEPYRGGDERSRAFRVQRGRELRAILDVDDSSALRLRTLRNHIEHMDDRLDRWAESVEVTGDRALYVRFILAGSATTFGLDPAQCFLLFDANGYKVTFGGEPPFELMPLAWAVEALRERVKGIEDTPPSAEELPPPERDEVM